MKTSQPTRFGLAGYGAWGKYHEQAIQSTSDCELTAVCAATAASRDAAAKETGARVFGSLEELLAKADVDVIDIVAAGRFSESENLNLNRCWLNRRLRPSHAKVRSTIQVSPVILKAR